jgi:hypothetical protein
MADLYRLKRSGWISLLAILPLLCSCSIFGRQNRVAVEYTSQISNLPGGIAAFWPDNDLKNAFTDYWNLRFSSQWPKAFEKEAPYFQEIVRRKAYENVIRGTVNNNLEKLEIQSIQKVTEFYYEVRCLIVFKNPAGEMHSVFQTDRWVYANRTWYHAIKDTFLFPMAS